MEFRHCRLPNGLEIAAEIAPQALSLGLGYFVRTGSRDEAQEVNGVSHFLEHMVFKGTERRTAEQINRELDDLGSLANAYTSEELTVYHITVLPENQDRAVELLTDMMRPALRAEDVETERQVILEEIAMYDDQPPYGAIEHCMENFFNTHPLSQRILGTPESVQALTSEQLRDYHRQRYSPDNICLIATGCVDFDSLVEQAERLTSSWETANIHRQLHPPQVARKVQFLHRPSAAQQYLVELGLGPARTDPARYACRVLASMLGDESGSRMFWELVDNGLADTAAIFTQEFQECGLVGSFMICSPDDLEINWQRFRDVVHSCPMVPFQDQELVQAKNKIRSSLVLGSERPSDRLFSVGHAWTLLARNEPLDEVLDAYAKVTLDDVYAVFQNWSEQPRVIVVAGPRTEFEIEGIYP